MARPMRKSEVFRRVRQEIKAALRLGPLVLASLLLAVILWRTDSVANSGLFQSPPPGTATVEPPTATAPTVPTPTEAVPATATPTQTPPPSDTPLVTEVPATITAAPTSTEATAERERYPEGESNLRFEWGMLFDSVSLFLSYVWLCCGIIVFLTVPVFFIALWVASKRREQQGE